METAIEQQSLIEQYFIMHFLFYTTIKLNTRGTYDERQMADRTGFSATTKKPTT